VLSFDRRRFLAAVVALDLHRMTRYSRKSMTDTFDIPMTKHNHIEADGVNVFYREAGPADAPVILLLHGFPTSSF
jgi:hypothetical protein